MRNMRWIAVLAASVVVAALAIEPPSQPAPGAPAKPGPTQAEPEPESEASQARSPRRPRNPRRKRKSCRRFRRTRSRSARRHSVSIRRRRCAPTFPSRSRSTSEGIHEDPLPERVSLEPRLTARRRGRDPHDLVGMGAPECAGRAGRADRGDAQGSELRSSALDVRDHEGLGAGELRDPHDLGHRDHRPQEPFDAARAGDAGRRPGAHPGGHAHPARGHARVRATARVAAGRAAAIADACVRPRPRSRASARPATSRT